MSNDVKDVVSQVEGGTRVRNGTDADGKVLYKYVEGKKLSEGQKRLLKEARTGNKLRSGGARPELNDKQSRLYAKIADKYNISISGSDATIIGRINAYLNAHPRVKAKYAKKLAKASV